MRIVTPSEVATQTQNKYLGCWWPPSRPFVNDSRATLGGLRGELTTRALDKLVRAG